MRNDTNGRPDGGAGRGAWRCARGRVPSAIALAFAMASAVAHGQDAPLVALHLDATPTAAVVEQIVEVRLVLEVDAAALDGALVQLSAARLDVPVELVAPWLEGLPSAPLAASTPLVERGVSLAVNGARALVVEGEPREVDGTTWRRFELARTLMPLEAGSLSFAAEARFATATAFEERLFGGRVPLDRVPGRVAAPAVEIDVDPWPAEAPASFQGAVGTFRLTAHADFGGRARLEVGDAFALVLELAGDGNLHRLTAPRVALDGFHARGWIERSHPESPRVFEYELELTDDDASELPPVRWSFLDPTATPPAYRELATTPIALPGRDRAPAASAPRLFAWATAGLVLAALAAWRVTRRRRA